MAFKLPNPSPFRQETDKPQNSFADNSFFTSNMRKGFGAGEYGTYSNPSFDPQTYASDSMGDAIASTGEKLAAAIADKKKMMTTSKDRPSFENKHKVKKTKTLKEGASPDLESKIQTAKSRGNLKRAARLEGRQERRVERQTEGAERIKARQAEKTAKVKKRQEDKTKKSLDTSTDGNNLQMKNDSPNKFMGGIAAAAGQIGMGNSSIMSGFLENNTAYQMAMQPKQAQQAVQGAQAARARGFAGGTVVPQATITDGVDPILAGAGVVPPGNMDQGNPFEGKTFQITPANMMGNAKPTFSEQTQGMAQTAFGSGLERQMSMPKSGSVTQMSAKQEKAFGPGSKVYEGGNTAIYDGLKAEDNSPAASYENPKTVINDSHGYVARKAAEAFGEIGAKLIEKKKGEKDENE